MTDRNARRDREAIGARLRFDVLRRCNFACYYCGAPAALGLKQLHIDHVIPVSLGGTNDPWNLVAACWDCNLGKAGMAPTEELIKQVREDVYYYASARNERVDFCAYCHIPIPVEPEDEFYGQCSDCLDARADAFHEGDKSGYMRAFNELRSALPLPREPR